jgi:parvulin-like peptidyl-prolyl isomerase
LNKNVGKATAGKSGRMEDEKSMPIFAKYGLIALAAVVVIAIVLVIVLSTANSYVGTVGGEKIGAGEFRYYLIMEKQDMFASAQAVDPNLTEDTFWSTKIGGENAVDVAKKRAIENIRLVKIQLIKAKESKISLSKDELKNIDDGIKSQFIDTMGSGNRIQANTQIKKQFGFTLDDIRNVQIENGMVQKYQIAELGKVTVSDEDIKKSYDDDTKSYDKVTVRQILFLYNGSDGKRSKEDSKKLADDTLAKIKAGEDMAALAEKLSEDPGVKDNKGEYTVTKFDNYVASFKDWSLKANVGDTAVVESTEYGYHVMKAEKREPQAFDAVKNSIKSLLIQDKFSKQYTEQMENWKKDAKYNAELNNTVYNSIT